MTDTNDETNPLDLGASPLAEAKADSLQTLLTDRIRIVFNTSPSKLNYDDKAAVVAYYRALRGQFLTEEAIKAAAPPKTKAKGAVPKTVAAALKMTDVDF